jgi:hypothetical protein
LNITKFISNPVKPIHQVNHLILLVGGNPLPNVVAGKSLILPGGQISLFYSRETSDIARKLERWFRKELKIHPGLIQVDAANPHTIRSQISSMLSNRTPETIGLNYTGGTKAMAVHTYQSVQSWAAKEGKRFISSYLDAQTLRFVIEENGEPTNAYAPYIGPYMGRVVEPTLDQLLEMHQWKLSEPSREAILPETARALSEIYSQPNKIGEWRKWKKALVKLCRPDNSGNTNSDEKKRWKEERELREIHLEFPASTGQKDLSLVFNTLRQELGLDLNTSDVLMGDVADKQGCKAADVCEWVDGKWLEHDCLALLRSLQTDLMLQDCIQNVSVKGKLGGYPEFEIDVVALRGYQLFAISCSTDAGWNTLKHKLFEVFIRARQIGGDEARVALVCPSDRPQELRNQVEQDMDLNGRICVFGRPHLPELKEEFRKWIENQCKEPQPWNS